MTSLPGHGSFSVEGGKKGGKNAQRAIAPFFVRELRIKRIQSYGFMDTSFSTLITINWTLIVHEFLFSNTDCTNCHGLFINSENIKKHGKDENTFGGIVTLVRAEVRRVRDDGL